MTLDDEDWCFLPLLSIGLGGALLLITWPIIGPPAVGVWFAGVLLSAPVSIWASCYKPITRFRYRTTLRRFHTLPVEDQDRLEEISNIIFKLERISGGRYSAAMKTAESLFREIWQAPTADEAANGFQANALTDTSILDGRLATIRAELDNEDYRKEPSGSCEPALGTNE